MWISKLELTCFKSYQHQVFTFPEPIDGKNIVLIGGMNGYGKTSILEGLYLCLYGKDAMVHLARAGLKTEGKGGGYPTFLERSFNGEALRGGSETMSIRIVLGRSKTKAIDICRRWFFRSNGKWTNEEEAVIRDVVRGVPESPKTDGKNGFHLTDYLEDMQFVPAHIAPFFFFDGEEVKKLADQSRVEQVKQGLEGLLGVVLLRTLAERLRTFESSKRNEIQSVDEQNLTRLYEELSNDPIKLNELKNLSEKNDSERALLREELTSLVDRITAAGGGGGDVATMKDLVEERAQYQNKMKESQKKLEMILAGRLPFQLVPKDLILNLKNQLIAEVKLAKHESQKTALAPRKEEFEHAFSKQTEPIIEPALTNVQLEAIKKRLDQAWASLFYPAPPDCAQEVMHEYLSESSRQKAIQFLDTLTLGQREIRVLISEQAETQQRIEELNRKISRLEGIDRDGTLTILKKSFSDVSRKVDFLTEQARVNNRDIDFLNAKVTNLSAEYNRGKSELDKSSPVRAMLERSERVRKVIEELVPALFPLKIRELGTSMTTFYKQLAHKTQVDKIRILDDGSTEILSKNGVEITFDRSAGENQIFATALIAGLAKVSGVKAPMVVDTPLGRLDSKHRLNILEFWTSDKNRQVILLSQDEEIDYHFYRQIESNVAKTYLLENTEVGDGIGRTTALEGKYFARGRR